MAEIRYRTPEGFDREKAIEDLKEKGYTVIPGVLTNDLCDTYIRQYQEWLSRFGDDSPATWNSLIQQYRVSHSEPTWKIRLHSKPVFSEIWGTEKLLSSMDGMAIGEPPELGKSTFHTAGSNWFHFDQGSWREGLHVYQGAVYLEETTEEDYCFRVIEGSLKHHREFLDTYQKAAEESAGEDFYRLSPEYVEWFKAKGVKEKKVPVPKGGMVLWDSRTIHDNVKPEKGRLHSDRWRYVVFVCMAPAAWAREKDIELKAEAYKKMVATAHWPSQGVWLFPGTDECSKTKDKPQIEMVDELPEIAKSIEVRRLVGLEPYNFDDGKANDLGWQPSWSVDISKQVKSSPTFA